MKRILVPTDLSDNAERGLQLAVEIAKRAKAEIYLTHFTRYPLGKDFSEWDDGLSTYDVEANLFNIELLQSNRSKLIFLGSHYAHEGVIINTEIVDEQLEEGIDTYIRQNKIELIVIGMPFKEAGKQSIDNSIQSRITTISSCPVIYVRDKFRIQEFRNIVLSIDEVEHTSIYPGVHIVKKVADLFDSIIHIVHVPNPLIGTLRDLELYILKVVNGFMIKRFRVEVLDGEGKVDVVRDYANRVGAGLIAVFKNSQTGIKIFSNTLSDQEVEMEIDKPVLTYTLQNV